MTAPSDSTPRAPWSFFERHRGRASSFFLDRAGRERPSFAGSEPRSQLVVAGDGTARLWTDGRWRRVGGDPIDAIAGYVTREARSPAARPSWLDGCGLPRTVGFLAYELGAWADGPKTRPGPGGVRPGTPLAVLSTYDGVDAWDPASGRSARVRFRAPAGGQTPPPLPAAAHDAWRATARGHYDRGFARIRDAIAAGEIYQANLSRRSVFSFDGDAAGAYANLRDVQPVPWGAFLDFGGFALLSNSPECFLERRGDELRTLPIKGTRPRHADAVRDAGERAGLVADPKEMAEHLMIVDLERNDLGRVATTGSVDVARFATVESYATLHHMVSEVRARLPGGTGLASLLRATFPGGSITGAPKIRAMEILGDVEDSERGPYTGAIGFFNGAGTVELAIAIRTAVASGDRVLYSSGGGLVADSDVDREWQETELKSRALEQALQRPARPADERPAERAEAGG